MRIDGTSALGPIDGWEKSSEKSVTTVQAGERSLPDVAQRLGVDSDCLQKANPHLSDTTKLTPGQEIRLPQMAVSGEDSEANSEKIRRSSLSNLPRAPFGDPLDKTVFQMRLNQQTSGAGDEKGAAQSSSPAQGSAGDAGVRQDNATDPAAVSDKGSGMDYGEAGGAGGGKSDVSNSSADGSGVDVKYGSTDLQGGAGGPTTKPGPTGVE